MREACATLGAAVTAMARRSAPAPARPTPSSPASTPPTAAAPRTSAPCSASTAGARLRPFDTTGRAARSIRCRSMSRSGSSAIGRRDLPSLTDVAQSVRAAGAGDVLRYAIEMIQPGRAMRRRRTRASPRRSEPLRPHPVTARVSGQLDRAGARGASADHRGKRRTRSRPAASTACASASSDERDYAIVSAMVAVHEARQRRALVFAREPRHDRDRAAWKPSSRIAAVSRHPMPCASWSTLHLIDTVGAWIASAPDRGRPGAARLSRRNAERNDGFARALDLATRCALARLSEIDDIHLPSMTTPGGDRHSRRAQHGARHARPRRPTT